MKNSQAAKNIAAEKNPAIVEDKNVYFSNYLNDLDNKNKDKSILLNDYQNSSQNFVNKNDETVFIESEYNLDNESSKKLISNHEEKDKELMLDVKKAK